MKPKVSIIIPAYNIGELIKETIDSALGQTYEDFELIVVDDGSTDNTADVVKRVKDQRLIYYYQPNSGLPSLPRIKGIELSRGEYLAFLDHDDLWLPRKLEKQLAATAKDPKIALVSTNAYFLYEDNKSNVPLIHGLGDDYFSEANLFPDNKVVQSTVLMRKAAYLEVGGLRADAELKAVEDYDLWIRTFVKYPCYFINECLVYYRRRRNSASGSDLIRFEREINHFNKYFASYGLPQKTIREKIAVLKRRRAIAWIRNWRDRIFKWLRIN